MMGPRALAASLLGFSLAAAPLGAQRLEIRGGRSSLASDFTILGLGWTPVVWGPFAATLGALVLAGPETDLYGGSADLELELGPRWRILAGAATGFASGSPGGDWGSLSAGLGWDVIRRPFVFGAEVRYREISDLNASGVDLGLRLAIPFGRRSRPARELAPAARLDPALPDTTTWALPDPDRRDISTSDALVATVVEIALAARGTPYLWGGSDANGFDCSGLIQHAYSSAGIALPRTSSEQARAGQAVPRYLGDLRPGDLLTFGAGDRVTHVGLFLGEGRFLHSASQGVRISRLSREDPDGRWWFDRWLGARRILPEGDPPRR